MQDGGFKNADARSRFLRQYEEVRALSPAPDAVHDVRTRYGTVRVYRHGPDHGIPLLLIPGFFLTSAMWWAQVDGLAGEFTVYAMDPLGQPGASVQSKAIRTPEDSSRCLDATLDGLGLKHVHVIGHSYGGWLATHTAARMPGRLATLTLVDPAATVARLSARFWMSLALQGRPNTPRARRAAHWISGHPTLAELFGAGFAHYAPPIRTPTARLISDRALRSVHLPVQVLLAGNTVHVSATGVHRIRSVVPSWQYRLWPYNSHALPIERASEINDSIRCFVAENAV